MLNFENLVAPHLQDLQILSLVPGRPRGFSLASIAPPSGREVVARRCSNWRFHGHKFQWLGRDTKVYLKQSRWNAWQGTRGKIDGTFERPRWSINASRKTWGAACRLQWPPALTCAPAAFDGLFNRPSAQIHDILGRFNRRDSIFKTTGIRGGPARNLHSWSSFLGLRPFQCNLLTEAESRCFHGFWYAFHRLSCPLRRGP